MLPTFCDGISRRGVLRLGSLAGLSLAEALRLQHASAASPASAGKKDVNCIFIFMLGGMPHQDMWDLKPDAPAEIRGDFSPISTAVPGVQISDCLPRVAQVTDKLAILRGMTHSDSDHGRGYHIMMTGVQATGAADFNRSKDNNQHPSLGSMVARMGGTTSSLPPYISLPNFIDSGGPAFLGASYAPFVIESDPASPEFSVRDITLPEDVSSERSRRRQVALRQINAFEQMLAQDLESLLFLRVPQIPSSRAWGNYPIVTAWEYTARIPSDPDALQIIPVPPRPFPQRLRDPDLLPPVRRRGERALAVWAVLSVVGIPWLLCRWWRMKNSS
jgi:hypothetical protein